MICNNQQVTNVLDIHNKKSKVIEKVKLEFS